MTNAIRRLTAKMLVRAAIRLQVPKPTVDTDLAL